LKLTTGDAQSSEVSGRAPRATEPRRRCAAAGLDGFDAMLVAECEPCRQVAAVAPPRIKRGEAKEPAGGDRIKSVVNGGRGFPVGGEIELRRTRGAHGRISHCLVAGRIARRALTSRARRRPRRREHTGSDRGTRSPSGRCDHLSSARHDNGHSHVVLEARGSVAVFTTSWAEAHFYANRLLVRCYPKVLTPLVRQPGGGTSGEPRREGA
jgi:hypothetical protein